MKRYVVNVAEAVHGKLPVAGGGGTFRILIDEETSGAKHFSLLVNEMAPGWNPEEIQLLTEPRLILADDLKEMEL